MTQRDFVTLYNLTSPTMLHEIPCPIVSENYPASRLAMDAGFNNCYGRLEQICCGVVNRQQPSQPQAD